MDPKGPSALPGAHFAQRGLPRRSCERCSITSRPSKQLAFAMAHEPRRCHKEPATLSDKSGLTFGGLFQLGELGTFLGTLPASLAAPGKGVDFCVLIARLRELLAGSCTNVTQRISIFRTALEELSCKRCDPRAVARGGNRRRHNIDIR